MMPDKIDVNTILKNLSEDEIKALNKATQEKISAIDEEKARKQKLKENYALKDVSSTWQINYEPLYGKINKHFKMPGQTILDISTFYELRKQCSYEVKPLKEEIYCCPECGQYRLEVGNWGDRCVGRYAITCRSCNFTMEKKEDSTFDAWRTFHNWLIKNGYLDKAVKFQW